MQRVSRERRRLSAEDHLPALSDGAGATSHGFGAGLVETLHCIVLCAALQKRAAAYCFPPALITVVTHLSSSPHLLHPHSLPRRASSRRSRGSRSSPTRPCSLQTLSWSFATCTAGRGGRPSPWCVPRRGPVLGPACSGRARARVCAWVPSPGEMVCRPFSVSDCRTLASPGGDFSPADGQSFASLCAPCHRSIGRRERVRLLLCGRWSARQPRDDAAALLSRAHERALRCARGCGGCPSHRPSSRPRCQRTYEAARMDGIHCAPAILCTATTHAASPVMPRRISRVWLCVRARSSRPTAPSFRQRLSSPLVRARFRPLAQPSQPASCVERDAVVAPHINT